MRPGFRPKPRFLGSPLPRDELGDALLSLARDGKSTRQEDPATRNSLSRSRATRWSGCSSLEPPPLAQAPLPASERDGRIPLPKVQRLGVSPRSSRHGLEQFPLFEIQAGDIPTTSARPADAAIRAVGANWSCGAGAAGAAAGRRRGSKTVGAAGGTRAVAVIQSERREADRLCRPSAEKKSAKLCAAAGLRLQADRCPAVEFQHLDSPDRSCNNPGDRYRSPAERLSIAKSRCPWARPLHNCRVVRWAAWHRAVPRRRKRQRPGRLPGGDTLPQDRHGPRVGVRLRPPRRRHRCEFTRSAAKDLPMALSTLAAQSARRTPSARPDRTGARRPRAGLVFHLHQHHSPLRVEGLQVAHERGERAYIPLDL